MLATLITMVGKYSAPKLVPDPATYLFLETPLRYEAVLARYSTRFTENTIKVHLSSTFYPSHASLQPA